MSDAFTDCANFEKKEKDSDELHAKLMQTDEYYRKMYGDLTAAVAQMEYYERRADSIRAVLRSIMAKSKNK